MKNILTIFAFLLAAVPAFAQSARYTPTGFMNTMVQTIGTQGAAQTYLGIGSSTNNALLNGTNTFTGTNTFPAASFYRANGLGWRLLYSSPTNINVASTAVALIGSITNNGDFANCTSILNTTMPALIGSNSSVVLFRLVDSPAQVTGANMAMYVGANTNFVGAVASGLTGTSAGRVGGVNVALDIISNAGSFTNNFQGSSFSAQVIIGPTNFVNTASGWKLYLGAYTTTSATNYNIRHLKLYEIFAD